MKIRENIKNHKTIVIKVGSTSIIKDNGEINIEKIKQLSSVLTNLRKEGKNVLLVSSGAIAVGAKKLGFKERPRDVLGQQVTSAVGQVTLIHTYEQLFLENEQKIAQVLLTRDLFDDKARARNFKNSIIKLFELGVIPIINENDTVSFNDELKCCDNDTLSAEICKLINGDILILLSDIDGMYTENPKINPNAKIIEYIPEITEEIESLGGKSSSEFGTGGMETKIMAAKKATKSGADTVICSGSNFSILLDVLKGKNIGTFFCSNK